MDKELTIAQEIEFKIERAESQFIAKELSLSDNEVYFIFNKVKDFYNLIQNKIQDDYLGCCSPKRC